MATNDEVAVEEWHSDLATEARITGKNRHSVYRLCPAHGWGIHGPMEDLCPSCGEHCILYLSGADVRQIVSWDDLAALQASNERLRAVVAPLEAWITHALSIMKDRRLVSQDGIQDGDAILQMARDALAEPW